MYTVDHLVAQHIKQMEKLSRQQEKAARKRERQQQKLETAFCRFREQYMQPLPAEGEPAAAGAKALPGRKGFMGMLRAFLF